MNASQIGKLRNLLLVALSAFVFCSGCVTVYTSRVYTSRLNSGVVPEGITLKNRYRIVSVSVCRSAEKPLYYESLLPDLVVEPESGMPRDAVYDMFDKIYPGVFSRALTAMPIHVDLNITTSENKGTKSSAWVSVSSETGTVQIASEDFRMGYVDVHDPNDPQYGIQGWCYLQSAFCPVGKRASIYFKTFELGFAGAIVAALEKYENDGLRVNRCGKPPPYIQIYHAPTPPPPAVEEPVAYERNDSETENTAAAVNFFTGAMGGINAMQLQKHARNQAYLQRQQVRRATRVNSRVSSSNVPIESPNAASKTCVACSGTGKCWGCKGKGSYQAAADVASTTTSPTRAAMAARAIGCRACGGTGACPRCGGMGKK